MECRQALATGKQGNSAPTHTSNLAADKWLLRRELGSGPQDALLMERTSNPLSVYTVTHTLSPFPRSG